MSSPRLSRVSLSPTRKTKSVLNTTKKPSTNRSESTISTTNSTEICQENHENLLFIWFDPNEQTGLNLVGPLRAINDHVQVCFDASSSLSLIRSAEEKIFFVTSTNDVEFIGKIHSSPKVEAIFILDPNSDGFRGDLPKICGTFKQQEELFRVLKDFFEIFEENFLENFSFENEKIFLWSQLFREDLLSRTNPLKKTLFIDSVRKYYQDNVRILSLIEDFEKTYRPLDVVNWCLRSPFPSRFIHHALRSHQNEGLRICQSLFIDAIRRFQQQTSRKTSEQFYRGMKIPLELVEHFEKNIGQLVSTNAFFPCTKSRTNALALASMPNFRSDLQPVLFKIDCDATTKFIEIPNKNSPSTIVFDLCVSFQIIYVNRGGMSVIKMRTAADAGRKVATKFLDENKDKTIRSILTELLIPPKPPTPPPPPKIEPKIRKEAEPSEDEIKAKEFLERGDVDLAIIAYHKIQPKSPRILNLIGRLCSEKKGDFAYALRCHSQALKIQEEEKEDAAETLTSLGELYHHFKEYDKAFESHNRALNFHRTRSTIDEKGLAMNLIGLAKVHWARFEYSRAIELSKEALEIRERSLPSDPMSIALTLALIGNIYLDAHQNQFALEYCSKALPLFEENFSENSQTFLDLLYNLASIQFRAGQFVDAQRNFERLMKIYEKNLPRGHPNILAVEDDLRNCIEIADEHQKHKERVAKRTSK